MGGTNSTGNEFLRSVGYTKLEEKSIREVFEKCDSNKDGVLDANEAAQFIHTIASLSGSKSPLLAKYDSNHDGTLDKKEATAFLTDLTSGVEVSQDEAVLKFYAAFASTKDGSISWESFTTPMHQQQGSYHAPKHQGFEEEVLKAAGIIDLSYNRFSNCPVYGEDGMTHGAPDDHMPEESMPPKVAYQIIHDELETDGKPRLNLATFVTTYMEKEAEQLMIDGMKINAIDIDEYKQTTAIHQRCVNMIARLFSAPLKPGEKATGTGCSGSSEAIMLATLAMKWKWKEWRQSKGLPIDKPNIVMGSNVQVCWHKACKYFEIEAREAPVSPDALVLTAARVAPLVDENTIGVCPILGSTFNGEFEDVQGIHTLVAEINAKNGWQIPIHVDAASGGFIAPFTKPELEWDFRLPWVKSINVSGHKYGLVYAGIGWALWREKQDLPEDLIFHVNYLGGDQASFTLNFSRPGSHFVGQYYNLIRFGKKGYRAIMLNGQRNAAYLRECLSSTGKFIIVDKAHMPLVAFALAPESNPHNITVFELQERLRVNGWIVPAYTCPAGATGLAIMRVVIKQNFTRHLSDLLVRDILAALEHLEREHEVMEATVKAVKAGLMFNGSVQKAVKKNIKSPKSASGKSRNRKEGIC